MSRGDAEYAAAAAPADARPAARPSTPALTVGAVVLGLVATLAIVTTPFLLFGYHSPTVHLVLDSVDACIALLVAYLLWGRFWRGRRLQDALLAEGLALLALASVAGGLLGAVRDLRPYTFEVWAPLSLRLLGALLLGAAGLSRDRTVPTLTGSRAVVGPLVLAGVAVGALVAFNASLPIAVTETAPASAARPVVSGHPLLLAAQAVGALSFVVAAASFTVQAGRREDVLLRWIGPACVLGAFSRLHYVLFPSIYTGWIYTGDLLRTASYLLLLVGAAREIGTYWRSQARLAVIDDRRRVARELHDGVVQELGYIRSEAHLIAGEDAVRRRIVDSVDRAIDEARAAVDALASEGDQSLGLLLHSAARQLTERYGGQVVVDLDVSVEATREQGHDLVRITREAVSNAIRHGRADRIGIGLLRDRDVRRLVVHDNGEGFDPTACEGSGYGMTSMRERAANLPGTFRVTSAPGRGATVVVEW